MNSTYQIEHEQEVIERVVNSRSPSLSFLPSLSQEEQKDYDDKRKFLFKYSKHYKRELVNDANKSFNDKYDGFNFDSILDNPLINELDSCPSESSAPDSTTPESITTTNDYARKSILSKKHNRRVSFSSSNDSSDSSGSKSKRAFQAKNSPRDLIESSIKEESYFEFTDDSKPYISSKLSMDNGSFDGEIKKPSFKLNALKTIKPILKKSFLDDFKEEAGKSNEKVDISKVLDDITLERSYERGITLEREIDHIIDSTLAREKDVYSNDKLINEITNETIDSVRDSVVTVVREESPGFFKKLALFKRRLFRK